MPDPDPTTGELPPEPSRLVAAVCEVMRTVGFVRGTGRNTDQGYGYTSDADLLRPLQEALVANGLMLHPVEVIIEREPHMKRDFKSGEQYQAGTKVYLVATYALRHTSGETITIQSVGCGFDSLDKAPYKAMTGAFKYAIRQTFAIPTGDDAERNQPRGRGPSRRGGDDGRGPAEPEQPVDREARKKFLRAWHARLKALADANLTPPLDDTERRFVQAACWGVESSKQLTDAACAQQHETLKNTEDGPFAAFIRQVLEIDQ